MHMQRVKPFTPLGLTKDTYHLASYSRSARGRLHLTSAATTSEGQAAANSSNVSVNAPSPSGKSKPQAWNPPSTILKIDPEFLEAGGLDVSREEPQARASFESHLASLFVPVNLDHSGVRIINIDPPVITVDNFLSPDQCDDIIRAASASGLMRQSGPGGAGEQVKDNVLSSSTTTLEATSEVLSRHPDLSAALHVMLSRAQGLLKVPLPAEGSATFARPSQPGQVAFELPQVAMFQPGQHFLTHEDAFPLPVVATKGYQRRATLLVYLNDCEQGGATRFDIVDIRVQPRKGTALLFFPSFSNGSPDRRTLRTAQDVTSEKWATQLWFSCGVKPQQQAGPGPLPDFLRGSRDYKPPAGTKGRKRGVPPQKIDSKMNKKI